MRRCLLAVLPLFVGVTSTIPAQARAGHWVVAWQDPAGFRVRVQFSVPATAFIDEFKMSRWAHGMGVVSRRWNTVNMGVDVILRPAGS